MSDGPTFNELLKDANKHGLRGDAAYEQIVRTSQRTDDLVTAAGHAARRWVTAPAP